MKAKDIRSMSVDEMKAKLRELRAELARQRARAATGGALENPSAIRNLRRAIARILAIIRESQEGGEG